VLPLEEVLQTLRSNVPVQALTVYSRFLLFVYFESSSKMKFKLRKFSAFLLP
jgi:hypothetical protein